MIRPPTQKEKKCKEQQQILGDNNHGRRRRRCASLASALPPGISWASEALEKTAAARCDTLAPFNCNQVAPFIYFVRH